MQRSDYFSIFFLSSEYDETKCIVFHNNEFVVKYDTLQTLMSKDFTIDDISNFLPLRVEIIASGSRVSKITLLSNDDSDNASPAH